jgi:hypothetical protein
MVEILNPRKGSFYMALQVARLAWVARGGYKQDPPVVMGNMSVLTN